MPETNKAPKDAKNLLNQHAVTGQIEKCVFHNADNGYSVLRLRLEEADEIVTVTGSTAELGEGHFVKAEGKWVEDKKYGRQFQADSIVASEPDTEEGIEKYLASGLIDGIGPAYAKKLMAAFGDRVFEVIETNPQALMEVEGIGRKRVERIIEAWEDQKAIKDIMVFLHAQGVGTAMAARIFKAYGATAIEEIKANPYRLANDIRGVGFQTADQIAKKLGFDQHSMVRARAGLQFLLSHASSDGHCGIPRSELERQAGASLQIPEDVFAKAIELELFEGELAAVEIDQTDCLFSRLYFEAENEIAEDLKRLMSGHVPWGELKPDAAIKRAEKDIDISLADGQRRAINQAICSKVCVITGGPGVGKTTIVNTILHILRETDVAGVDEEDRIDTHLQIALCAPTGRAAKRMKETTRFEAKTIHRLLEADPISGKFSFNRQEQLEVDLLVVDEASMIDVLLMRALLAALPDHTALIIVGDRDQLPSVGPGQVLADILSSNEVPAVELTEIFRQAAESKIITYAHKINAGEMPDWSNVSGDSDFFFVGASSASVAQDKIKALITDRIPKKFSLDPKKDIQLLTPMNRGELGTKTLNTFLQKLLNPASARKMEILKSGTTYRVGDKIMQTRNDHEREIYNGDIGYVLSINEDEEEIRIDFEGREIDLPFSELERLTLAYAVTIHKSQGSEYPVIVLPMTMQHFPMLQRKLLYTGVTRGKRLVILVGETRAIEQAVEDKRHTKRWSRLGGLLGDGS